MFVKCEKCGYVQEIMVYEKNQNICTKCNYYGKLTARQRMESIIDENSFEEINGDLGFCNPIRFPGYEEKYHAAIKSSGINEGIVTGSGTVYGIRVMVGIMEPRFMMGSMGTIVGEKVTLIFERAQQEHIPVILFCASGGARMQEGVLSLMQMAKTASAVAEFSEAGGFFISVLTNPTTGGVSASFAFLGDIILAEPQALIGFAGKRVIEDTISQRIPDHFQTAEYLMEHGFIDAIVNRQDMKKSLHQLLTFHRT